MLPRNQQFPSDALFHFNVLAACAWGAAAAAPATGGGMEGAAEHRSWGETQEICDISQTDFCLRDRMEETGRGCGDMLVYYPLSVKGPWRGQQGALTARVGQCLGSPTFCSPLTSLPLPSCKCQAGQAICREKAVSSQIRAHCICPQHTTCQAAPGTLPGLSACTQGMGWSPPALSGVRQCFWGRTGPNALRGLP